MPPFPAWALAPQAKLSFSSHLDCDFLCQALPLCAPTPLGMPPLCQRLPLPIKALLGALLCEYLPQPTWTFASHFGPLWLLPALIPTPCAGDYLVFLYVLAERGLNCSGREGGRWRRKSWYLISYVLVRNWSVTLYLKGIQDKIFGKHYLSWRIWNMLLFCVLVLKVTVEEFDAKLIYFSLRVSLTFCLKAV